MGSPELPGDEIVNRPLSTTQIINFNPNTSDESDGEDDPNAYDGYEPLAMTEQGDEPLPMDEDDRDTGADEPVSGDSNLPTVISTDAEIEQEVWSQPRPRELEINLDNSRTEQIMSAMATITLPTTAIPEWAQGVPEERWKHDLLERIRQRKDGSSLASTMQL